MAFRFIAWGDSLDASHIYPILSAESVVINSLNPNFTIFGGDLINGDASNNPDYFINNFPGWKNAFNGNGSNNLFDKTFAVRGNHDANTDVPWRADFNFAGVASSIGATNYTELSQEMTYSFDYDNSHFIGIDDPTSNITDMSSPALLTWLDNDLSSAECRGLTHAFLFWHAAMYLYAAGWTPASYVPLMNVFNKHPIISATFYGHDHFLTATYIDSSRISVVTHPFEAFVSGGAGAPIMIPTTTRYDYWLNDGNGVSKFGFWAIDVSGATFTAKAYNVDGSIDRTLSFSNNSPPRQKLGCNMIFV